MVLLFPLFRTIQKHIIYNRYCVLPNVVTPTSKEEERISQILHMSSNYLDNRLTEQVGSEAERQKYGEGETERQRQRGTEKQKN